MKYLLLVNPSGIVRIMRDLRILFVVVAILAISCEQTPLREQFIEESPEYNSIDCAKWTVQYSFFDEPAAEVELNFRDFTEVENDNSLDSLNFHTLLPDSLRYNRRWHLGAASDLIFSITISADNNQQLHNSVKTVCETALLVEPPGLRSVSLSNRHGAVIDTERASAAVEPPPFVTHNLFVYYQQDSLSTELEVIDSMIVDFRGSNSDSLQFVFINRDGSTAVSSTTGLFRRTDSSNNYNCYADSSGLYVGVFQNRFQINMPYLDSEGRIRAQSRLTSAFLSGDAYYPLSNTPANYNVQFFLPTDFTAWTPLDTVALEDTEIFVSQPGGIVGGLPIAIGIYKKYQLTSRYSVLSFAGSEMLPSDSSVVNKIVELLVSTIDFRLAQFCFVEINNPDHELIIPGFGGILYSEGSLASLDDVSDWDNLIAEGRVPEGTEIISGAAEAVLLQSLQLDPILFKMLRAWLPLRYFHMNADDVTGSSFIRKSYLKSYLYNTEVLQEDEHLPAIFEYALADQMLVGSPLEDFVSIGKGVVVLEYLYSLRKLNRLPYLLENFRHSSSANYWRTIIRGLNILENSDDYNQLRTLFYQPGIPQIEARWWLSDGKIFIKTEEFQPGMPFNLELNECQLILPDTVISRNLISLQDYSLYQCTAPPDELGELSAIDLNSEGFIPADIIYRKVTDEEDIE